ncbi:MAG: hypothetical protein MJZ05_03075 [Fibrobacter sp.]|nr:hypothetical protein [Fibrobacter sp.]
MNKKKYVGILFAFMLAFGLAACGDDNPSGSKDVDSSSSSVTDECECDEDSGVSSESKNDKKSSSSVAAPPSIKVEKGTIEDSRDGKVYKTVKIGAQTWMAENLNYKVGDSKCEKDDSDCKNGRLYHWADAMDFGVAANTSSAALLIKSRHKGICPDGFHVPSKKDVRKLFSQPLIDGVSGKVDFLISAEDLVFLDYEECRSYLKNNHGPDESDFCNLYKFNGELKKHDHPSSGVYWTAFEIEDESALTISVVYQTLSDDEGGLVYGRKSGDRYLRCVSDDELCGGKELDDNQFCYKEKAYNMAKSDFDIESEYDEECDCRHTYDILKDEKGLTAYNPLKYVEENGKLIPLCNGKKLADGTFCVADKVYDKCGGEEYNVKREFCRQNKIVAICDTIGEDKFCVDGFVYDKCGGEEYDVSEDKCVKNVVNKMCGTSYYPTDKQFCVDETVYDKCNGEKYDVTEEKCVKNVVNKMCGTSYYPTDKQFCVAETIYDKCGGEEYDVIKEKCVDNVIYSICGSSYYLSNKQFCEGGIVFDKCGGVWYDVANNKCVDDKVEFVYGELKDSRDGQTYKTIKIGSQTWMAENLNYQIGESKCYDDKPENCEKYGRLYTWDDAACPEGWRLPSTAEFRSLLAAVGTSDDERALNLRAGSWENGTDKFGFSALPAGRYGSYYKEFSSLGSGTSFWASTVLESGFACLLSIYDNRAYVNVNGVGKVNGYSVRCLQD